MKTIFNKLVILVTLLSVVLITSCKESVPFGSNDFEKQEVIQSDELVLFTWEEYIDPTVVAAFTEETGIKVRIETYESLTQMKAYLRSKPGQYDIAVVDDFYVAELSELRLISSLDIEAIPNVKNISQDFLNLEFDPTNKYSVPYTWGTVLVAYRSDKIEDPKKSWSLLWDEKIKGHISLLEDKEDVFTMGLLVEGFSPRSENKDELEQVAKKMLEHAKQIRPKYLDLEDVKSQLSSGEIWASNCYSGDAMVMAENNENISCFIPSEGAPLWIDNFTIVRDAPNRDNAHKFIDFMSRGEVAGQNANFLWTATPNKAAIPFLDPEIRDDDTVFLTQEMFEKCDFYALPTADRERITNEGMKAIMDEIHTSVTTRDLPE